MVSNKLHIFKLQFDHFWRISISICETITTVKIKSYPSPSKVSLHFFVIPPFSSSLSSLNQPLICLTWLEISLIFPGFYVNGIIVCTPFCLASFTLHNYFEIHLCCLSICSSFLFVPEKEVYHCFKFVYSFTADRHLGCF